MKVAVLGTGAGARAHIARLLELGHRVTVGTRDPVATLARSGPDRTGAPPYRDWLVGYPQATPVSFEKAAAAADVVINGIEGSHAVDALVNVRAELTGTVLIDYAVPFVHEPEPDLPWHVPWGVMPAMDPAITDSLGERIQRALPGTRVVKTFVTQHQDVVVDPKSIGDADHTMFLAGDHPCAKTVAAELLNEYGWNDILDLGALANARALELECYLHMAIEFALGRQFGLKVI
ncbi:NAD(P)-binding domain-containing protein [Nocardia sp. 2]|uniref:NAD(P)-binding domain-containing protein n=1 Tax=Nocardia acididurans TaxID=2802282 RepID=A0ABS1MGB3_9NOCA|nr:NAD(P)-binding domain-containing protein [Nocardia acididurans]MBL1079619.1 NAD(P)-binding domain-containing protein [Nocardia acididurans]